MFVHRNLSPSRQISRSDADVVIRVKKNGVGNRLLGHRRAPSLSTQAAYSSRVSMPRLLDGVGEVREQDGILLASSVLHAFGRFAFRQYFLGLIFGQYLGFNDYVGRVKRRSDASTAGVSPLPSASIGRIRAVVRAGAHCTSGRDGQQTCDHVC